MKLAAKLALSLMFATALVFGIFGWQLRIAQQRNAEQMVTATAERICDIIRRSTRYQMLRNDREALYRTIRDIGSEAGIRQIRIFSKTGQIRFSTNDAELNRVVDKGAEACYACHAQAAPLEKLNRADRARIFTSGGERILAVILPIENQPDCSSAACHVHPQRQKVLGVIDAHLSLAAVDHQIAEQQALLERFTFLASVLFGLLSLGFLWLMVYRPLRDLVRGIRKVGKGEVAQAIPVRSRDELGEVASEFNHMMEQLGAAQLEITAWTKTLEERVERKSRELERAHHGLLHSEKLASVGKLAATVAHEINNPLFGILTNARLAKRQVERANLDAEMRGRLDAKLAIIERESQRCGEIVKNLLAFSRQSKPQLEAVALSTVIERAVALIRHGYELQNIQLRINQAGETALVRGDAGQLQQVLLVLLVNAADAMKEGGEVAITTEVEGEHVRLRVRDNGPGIPEEIRERIFEPFFSTKEDAHGTGLGLAIAQGIVEQHQGTIQLTSEVGQGTEFLIQLPLVAAAESVRK
jgi:two-component system, NtrC family, sensor kinase